jgi:GNAT superfamily N-acetyltransferase
MTTVLRAFAECSSTNVVAEFRPGTKLSESSNERSASAIDRFRAVALVDGADFQFVDRVVVHGAIMTTRALSSADRPLLREATLANMNWNEPRFTFDDVDASHEISHYFTDFPSDRDFGLAYYEEDDVKAVAWLVFLPVSDPGYGFVDADTPELCITTFSGNRGRGIGGALLAELISQARDRGLGGISLSVEDGNVSRHLYERASFEVAGRNQGSDTMFLALT